MKKQREAPFRKSLHHKQNTMAKNVILSGGGTGGHIFPAIAIADALKEARPDTAISFVGASDRMEMQRVPAAGYPITGLWISGIQRKLTLKNLMFPFKLISSLWKSHRIIKKNKPAVVIGTGGFASGPLLYAASRAGIPIVIQEQNSFPGITNKILAKRAAVICVAFEGLERWFPKDRIVLTGNPIRSSLLNNQPAKTEACQSFGLDPERPVILVTGGSLGAASINKATKQWVETFGNSAQLIWQTGKVYADSYVPTYSGRDGIWINAFIDDMDKAYAAADLVVARAGASTLSELCALGKASVLIHSPWVAEDHQRKNADSLKINDAAAVVDENEIDTFPRVVNDLIGDADKRQRIAAKAKAMGKPNATQDILHEVLKLIDR